MNCNDRHPNGFPSSPLLSSRGLVRANDNSGEVEREQERETKVRQIMGQGGSGEKREIELSDFSDGVGLGGASSAAEFINRAELPQSGRDSEVLLRKVGSYPPSIANGEIA